MVSRKRVCDKIVKLFEKYSKIRETQIKRHSFPGVLAKLKDIKNELQRTFPPLAGDAKQVMKNQEDIKFLQSMKTDRVAS